MKIKLTKKKECTVLTWPAKILVFSFVLLIFSFIFSKLPLYLSKNRPLNGDYLVLDGQMPDYSIEKAIQIFHESGYKTIITTGGKLPSGYYISGKTTMAELTYATFLELGFDSAKIVFIPGGTIVRDRTYSSGLSLKKWFFEHGITHTKVNVLAVGSHARRSQDLFQKALGDNFEVGIISVEDINYDKNKWWKASIGVRTVMSEIIAYFYVKLFFYPDKEVKK
jgi:hypothetical protein